MNKKFLIYSSQKIKNALSQIKESGARTLVVVNTQNKLLGTISDGDIRKSILRGVKITNAISICYNKKPKFFYFNKYSIHKVKNFLLKKQIGLIPIVNNDFKVVKVLTWDNIFEKKKLKNNTLSKCRVVIMAGGKGTRLKPYTSVLPKPLIPIGNKPIIEHIISNFNNSGISNFILTINYKAKIIQSYFQESKKKYKIQFTEEKKPLGTAGALRLIKYKTNTNFFVTNCDTLFKTNFKKMFEFHAKNKFMITVGVSFKTYKFPYGVCEINKDGVLKSIKEKPSFNFFVSTGLYVVNKKIVKLIPKNKFFDMTKLIQLCVKENYKIGTFPIKKNHWVDMGQLSDYRKATLKI